MLFHKWMRQADLRSPPRILVFCIIHSFLRVMVRQTSIYRLCYMAKGKWSRKIKLYSGESFRTEGFLRLVAKEDIREHPCWPEESIQRCSELPPEAETDSPASKKTETSGLQPQRAEFYQILVSLLENSEPWMSTGADTWSFALWDISRELLCRESTHAAPWFQPCATAS